MRAEPGRLLARGREADVFEAGSGRVLRRYRNRAVLENEVIAMRWAHAQGYPAPQLFDVDGADMLMERVGGRTMLADLRVRPWRMQANADLLASLHLQLHAIPPPPGMQLRYPTGGDTFVHLDLHPENVLFGRERVVVIDWAAARRGPAAVDVAYTWLVMASSEIPGGFLTRRVASILRDTFVQRFLSHFPRREIDEVVDVVATHRVQDRNVTDVERTRIAQLVRAARGAAAKR